MLDIQLQMGFFCFVSVSEPACISRGPMTETAGNSVLFGAPLSFILVICRVEVKCNVEDGEVILSPRPVALQSHRETCGACFRPTPLKAMFIQHQIRLFNGLFS